MALVVLGRFRTNRHATSPGECGLLLARVALMLVADRWAATGALVAGTWYRPYVYRQLTPAVIRVLMALTGSTVETAAAWTLRAACVGWLWALWYLASAVLDGRTAYLAALAAPIFCLPFLGDMYVYDMPSLALFTLGLAFLVRRQWTAYLIMFPFAVLCRETVIFLTPVYLLLARSEMSPRRLALATAYQIGATAVIKLALGVRYAANPGELYQSHVLKHYWYLKQYPAGHIVVLIVLAALLLLLLWRWRALPAVLKAIAILIPVFFGAYIILGHPFEFRGVLEVYPVLYLLVFYILWTHGVLPLLRRLKPGASSRLLVDPLLLL